MLEKFSFLYHHLEKILCVKEAFAPGALRVDIIYYDDREGRVKAKTKDSTVEIPAGIAVNIEGFKPQIDKLRKLKRGFYWFNKSEIPWRIPDFENKKSNLLSELDVLMIAIENYHAKPLNDLIFFYFHKNLKNLRMDTGNNELSMRERDLVGRSYASSLNGMIALANSDVQIWSIMAEQFKNAGKELEAQRKSSEALSKKFQDSFVSACNYYLEKISQEQGREFYFSEGAIEKIKKFHAHHVNMEEAVDNAVIMARIAGHSSQSGKTEIAGIYLNFTILDKNQQHEEMHDFEFDKAFNYLNKLEDAVARLKHKKMPVIGDNVAATMKPPVSKSSITMYVQNHQKEIKSLFKLYPDHWQLTKLEFKTVVNLLANQEIKANKSKINN